MLIQVLFSLYFYHLPYIILRKWLRWFDKKKRYFFTTSCYATVILTFHHSTGSQQSASRGRVLAFYRIAPCLSRVDHIRVRYHDDENCYVNLEEALMGELFRCAWNVPGTDWKRINVQFEVWYSPRHRRRERKIWNLDSTSTSHFWRRTQLHTTYIDDQSNRYTSPVENIIRSKEGQIRKQEAGFARKTHEIASLEQSFS